MADAVIGDNIVMFIQRMVEAKRRGKILRAHSCSQCEALGSIEFDESNEVQVVRYQCSCGSVEKVTHFP